MRSPPLTTSALFVAGTVLVGLAAPSIAQAQTSAQTGAWIDVHPGLGVGGAPVGATFGTRVGLGYWWGNYDRDFLLGRSWGVGLAARADLFGPELRLAPALEVKRTVDLLVVGYRWRVLVGPELDGDALGVGARLGAGLKVRPSPYIGPTLDVEAGAAWVDGKVSPRFGLHLGVEVAFSWSGREDRDPGAAGGGS